MQKWEYKYAAGSEELAKMGDEGWEMVAIGGRGGFYCKRPK